MARATVRRSTLILDLLGLQTPSCLSEQTSSHSLQPVHLFLKTSSRIFYTNQVALVSHFIKILLYVCKEAGGTEV
jgi:hypothetical protein